MKSTRCDEVIVQIIVRSYDKHDRPIGEAVTQPVKIFRSQTPDFWRYVDQQIAANTKPAKTTPAKRDD